jgi:hypothetical protein
LVKSGYSQKQRRKLHWNWSSQVTHRNKEGTFPGIGQVRILAETDEDPKLEFVKPGYTVKKVIVFPVPSGDVINQTLHGRELLNYSRPGRVWLVTSRLGTGKTITFYYSVLTETKGEA